MQIVKMWLCGACLGVALAGTAMLIGTPSTGRAEPERREERQKDRWQHHDGRWSYWHEGDKRWYYTDGAHWYYNTGDAWQVYRFDKHFGRDSFERGEYKVPAEDVKVVVPRHGVWKPR